MPLIDTLLKRGEIDKKIADEFKKKIESDEITEEELLIKEKVLPEEELFQMKSKELGIPLVKSLPKDISQEILEFIPRDSAEHYRMCPISKKDKKLIIAMVYPENLKAQEALNFLSRQKNFSYSVVLITISEFQEYLKQYQSLGREVRMALQELEQQLQATPGEKISTSSLDIVKHKGEAPISKTVAVMLKHAVEGHASDIHVEPSREKTRIRFRLDGILHSSLFLPREVHPSIVARIKIVSKLKIDESRIPQDGRFSVIINGQSIDFRVSTFPTTLGEKVVMRVLNPANKLDKLEDLGLEASNLKLIKKAIQEPYGMILSTGPTGSGKTTTLYVILERLNKDGVNIVTLEDPVEYFIEGVSQSQIKPEIGYTFATGLRHILRQDPDIIMVGEIRDKETANLATHAALTGHIVLSTLHTNNAIGAIPRLTDLGVKPFLLPSTITVVMAQRLLRRLCPHCKKKVRPSVAIGKFIRDEIAKFPAKINEEYRFNKDFWIWEPAGCSQCGGKGYSGRTAVFEVLSMTKELADIILTNFIREEVEKEANRQGMITMRQDGVLKLLKGETSVDEVVRVTSEG
ncbi:GspE/PulE family protein [Patescibacteria group bacterium]|nr:GspE/PulE family protein [Patescibacteria group bacterium]MBU4022827.1 GspE/PulE family protein [Patescibacteria group bacterium]MBU4078436.1 GspE/PulE family protein [Patescibacteria group bacterium]